VYATSKPSSATTNALVPTSGSEPTCSDCGDGGVLLLAALRKHISPNIRIAVGVVCGLCTGTPGPRIRGRRVSFAVEPCDTKATSAPGPVRTSCFLAALISRRNTTGMMTKFSVVSSRSRRFTSNGARGWRSPMAPTSPSATSARDFTITERGSQTRRRCACGHPREEHDPIAARYCAATASNQLRRRCICMAPSPR
jgi:hypothetical protein